MCNRLGQRKRRLLAKSDPAKRDTHGNLIVSWDGTQGFASDVKDYIVASPFIEKQIYPPANTVGFVTEQGEIAYYRKSTGEFIPLSWSEPNYDDVILSTEEMKVARKAAMVVKGSSRFVEKHLIRE